MPQRTFYATPADLLLVLTEVEWKLEISYVEAGLFDTADFKVIARGRDLPCIQSHDPNDQAHSIGYLVVTEAATVAVRAVSQRRGGTKYAIDQLRNPDSAVLYPGGEYSTGVLISGSVGTASAAPVASQIQSAFETAISKCFERIKSVWVGPTAQSLLAEGWRLTHTPKASREYDLVASDSGA